MDMMQQLKPGMIIAAPRSGGGKTTLTLGLLRALTASGVKVQPFKCGPDYIDPAFHAAATGRPSVNLDSWAMRRATVGHLIATHTADADLALCEGVMGLFDGVAVPGAWGTGATADIAAAAGWPVLLVLDVSGQAQTVAAVALGCARLRPDVTVAGVILNRVGSERHRRLAAGALEAAGISVFGALPRNDAIALPERHLGLVQAGETQGLDAKLDAIAGFVAAHVDLSAVRAIARTQTDRAGPAAHQTVPAIAPPGQRIALASDAAFSFIYPHMLASWRAAGAEVLRFSPLANQSPDPSADAIWLPGGYPELHAGAIAASTAFLTGLRAASARNVPVHGECGGFMVLGGGLVDAAGARHAMAGLLGLEASYAKRKLHLGYRQAVLSGDCAIGRRGDQLRGHEFHYCSVLALTDEPLADITDAEGVPQPERGARRGSVSGSFFHAIDAAGT
jgi:cobyrinic acid a,c-diamide synthase